MKVNDTGSFPAIRPGRAAPLGETSLERQAARSGEGRVSLSSRVDEVDALRRLALAAPEVRPEVVEAARAALKDGSLSSVDSLGLAARIFDDLGF